MKDMNMNVRDVDGNGFPELKNQRNVQDVRILTGIEQMLENGIKEYGDLSVSNIKRQIEVTNMLNRGTGRICISKDKYFNCWVNVKDVRSENFGNVGRKKFFIHIEEDQFPIGYHPKDIQSVERLIKLESCFPGEPIRMYIYPTGGFGKILFLTEIEYEAIFNKELMK